MGTQVTAFFARAGGAFGANLVSAGLTFGLHIVLARILGETEYGIYAYFLTWITIIALFTKLGFDTALVRYIPEYSKSSQWQLLFGVIQRSRRVCGWLAALISAGLAGILVSGIFDLFTTSWWTFATGLIVLPILVDTHLLQAVLRGLHMVPKNELPDRVIRPAVMLALIAAAVAFGFALSAPKAMFLHLCGLLVAYAVAHRWMTRSMPKECRFIRGEFRTRAWLTTAFPLAGVASMHLALANIDILMIGALIETTDAGVYSVAARVAVFVIFALTAVNAIAAPVIAENFNSSSRNALQRLLTRSAQLNLVFAGLVALALGLFGRGILEWFGPQFVEGYTALIILCMGHVVNAACGSVGSMMTMTGHERAAAKILLGAVAINLIANILLIPIWGMVGAAMATSGTTVFWNLLMLDFTWRHLGINVSAVPLGNKPRWL